MAKILQWKPKTPEIPRWWDRRSTLVFAFLVIASVFVLVLTGCSTNRGADIIERVTEFGSDGVTAVSLSETEITGGRQRVTWGGEMAAGAANLHYEAGQSEDGGDFLVVLGSAAEGLKSGDPVKQMIALVQAVATLQAAAQPGLSTGSGLEIDPGPSSELFRRLGEVSERLLGVYEGLAALSARVESLE